MLSRIQLFATPWTIQSMEFSRGGQNTKVGSHSLLQGIFTQGIPGFDPGIEPRSPTLQADSLPAEPQGKPKNTGVGSLFLLQLIFLTQQSIIEYQLAKQTTPHLVHINSVFLLSASNSVCQGRTCPYFLVGLSAAQPSFPINFSNVTL